MSKDITSKGKKEIFKEKRVKVGDIIMNYAEAGEGDVIVLVHGWNNNWRGFIPLARYLGGKYRVVMVDLPGFGDSDRLQSYSLEIEAYYLNKFIHTLKIKNPIVAGHSMGAYIVGKFYNLYPESAKRIILIAPMFKRKSNERLMKFTEYFYRVVRKTKLTKRLLKKIVDTDIYSYITAKYINMYKFNWHTVKSTGVNGKKKVCPEAYVDMGVEITSTYTDKLIENNKIPIGLVFGKYDKLTNAVQARKMLEGKGVYNFAEVNRAGHILTVEMPKETAETICSLLKN